MTPLAILLAVSGLILGGGGLAALLRARSGVKVDEADAATTVVNTSIALMAELKEERSFARTEVHQLKNQIMVQQGQHVQALLVRDAEVARLKVDEAAREARVQLEREALTTKWEQCERRSTLQDREIEQQGVQIRLLSEAVDALKATVDDVGLRGSVEALHVEVAAVKHEVTTGNAQTIAQLADQAETRRARDVPEGDRTEAEQGHLDELGGGT